MSRSSKKIPYVAPELMKRIEAMNESGKKEVLKTWSRASTIYPQMVGHTIAVHDGRKHVPIYISEEMIGHKLGEFAPNFAYYNDDILFGENWNDPSIDIKTRCIITVVALMSSGITDNSLKYHLENAKKNGVSREEMVGIITHTAFYVGWPKGWAVFNLAKDIYNDNE